MKETNSTVSVPAPAEILAGGTPVKINPVRKVLRYGEFFLKLDTRPGSSFSKEFRGARLLDRAGIPVAEHLAFGRIPEGSYLITRAWGDGSTVRNHVELHGIDRVFLERFAAFLNRFYASRLWHGDLHWGNVLYDRAAGRFAFVDVRAVSRSPLRRIFCGGRLRHIAMDLRAFLSRPDLLAFLKTLGVARPEAWFLRSLESDSRRIRREWSRRREQILSGYPKFTEKEGGRLWSVLRASAEEIADAELVSGADAESVFLAHFYLQLMAVPHRRALWFDRETHTVALERLSASGTVPAEEEILDWQDRLRRIGGASVPADWERLGNTVSYRGTADFARRLAVSGGLLC